MNKLKIFIAIAALSGSVGANVLAKENTVNNVGPVPEIVKISKETVEEKINTNPEYIQTPNVTNEPSEEQYTVKPEDTLSEIAINHNVSVEEIKEWNELSTDVIQLGVEIVIHDEETSGEGELMTNNAAAAAEAAEVEKPEPPVNTEVVEPEANKETPKESPIVENNPEGQEITVTATAYTASCKGCSGITATGVNIKDNPDKKVIAVDPSVIPLGTEVYVEGYGYAIAADTGGAIKGNKIDVFISEQEDAVNWGKKQVEVTILN